MGFNMRKAVAAATVAITAFAFTAGPAAADEPGIGVTTGQASLLSLRIGSGADPLLDLRLMAEEGSATVDARGNEAGASERVTPLVLRSSLLGDLSLPSTEVATTNGEQAAATSTLDLGGLADSLGLSGLLDGALNPISLRSAVNGLLAEGSATSAVAEVDALFGLLGLDTLTIGLLGSAEDGGASASRGLELANLDVLGLDGLLGMLGLDLLDLPLANVLGILDFAGIRDAAATGFQVGTLLSSVTEPVCAVVGPVLAVLGVPNCAGIPDLVDTVSDTLDSLLNTILGELTSLNDTSLLSLSGISIEALTDAGRTVAASSADTNASVGGVSVLGVALPLDVASVLQLVNSTLDTVTGLLGVGDLLDLDLFEESSGVNLVDGVVQAVAEVTGVGLSLNLDGITGLVDGLLGQLGLGELLGLSSAAAVNPLGGLLEAFDLTALDGLGSVSLQILSVGETSTFGARALTPATPTTPTAPTDPGPLARTGGTDTTLVLLGAAAMVAVALGGRRFLFATVDSK